MHYNFNVINEEISHLINKTDRNIFKGVKILITGCNGLIGSYLLNYFYELGKIIELKVVGSSQAENFSSERFSKEIIDSVEYFSWDASTAINKEFLDGVDYVYYCSGYAQPAKFIKDPLRTTLINTLGLDSILSELKKGANFIYMSSSEIYGDPDKKNIPTKETFNGNYNVASNRAFYIGSKRIGESFCLSYSESLKIKICRVSLTYGPGTSFSDDRVIQQFIRKAKSDGIIRLIDDGSAVRTFCYIRDSVEMILNVSTTGKDLIYNIATNRNSVTILELAKLVGKYLNAEVSAISSNESQIGKNSPLVVLMDISKYISEFNKEDFVTVQDGLGNVLKYFNLL